MQSQSLALSFTLACPNGHRAEVDEVEGKRLNGTCCTICFKPMLVVNVRTSAKSFLVGTAPEQLRCPQHSNGDPCCRRQGQ